MPVLKTLTLGEFTLVIDRPRGFRHTFQTSAGPKALTYPLDYGFVTERLNPQDGEPVDVFVGKGGNWHGRFMKGRAVNGRIEPDEYKWYVGCTDKEMRQLMCWWRLFHDPGLTTGWTTFPDHDALFGDIVEKTVAVTN